MSTLFPPHYTASGLPSGPTCARWPSVQPQAPWDPPQTGGKSTSQSREFRCLLGGTTRPFTAETSSLALGGSLAFVKWRLTHVTRPPSRSPSHMPAGAGPVSQEVLPPARVLTLDPSGDLRTAV